MKNGVKRGKAHINGAIPTRAELIAAQEQALEATAKMSAKEGFHALVRAGIFTPGGKLTRRYGGAGKDKPWSPYSAGSGRKKSTMQE